MKRLVRRLVSRGLDLTPVGRAAAAAWHRSVDARERSGELARYGGRPLRNVGLRPWASVTAGRAKDWHGEVGGLFRDVYVGGIEGLPQPRARAFAEEWAKYCDARHALLVAHGTDALRIALAAVFEHDGLSYGGEIIVPNFSFIASATAPLDRRFGIALVDVDPDTLLLDPDRVEAAVIPGRTRGLMAVHLFGQPADMTRLREVADRHGLQIIEDAAQAHGAAWLGRRVGTFGAAAAFSFQSSKSISAGEGGAIVTNDDDVFERAYSIHNVGRSRLAGGRWEHVTLGWNCRPTEYQAILLQHRLATFDQRQAVRATNVRHLSGLLRGCRSVRMVPVHPNVTAHGMYMFPLRYQADACGGAGVDEFVACLRAEGVPAARSFASTIAGQPAIRELAARHPDYVRVCETPVADQAALDTLYLPHELFLGDGRDMDDIAAAIRKVELGLRTRTER